MQPLPVIVFSIITLLTFQDIYRASVVRHAASPNITGGSTDSSIPTIDPSTSTAPSFTDIPTNIDSSGSASYGYGNHIHVSYCVGCQYGGRYQQLKKDLETAFPGIEVTGSNHPVGLLRNVGSYAILGAQMGVAALTLAGDRIFQYLGKPVPAMVTQMQQSKLTWGMGVWYGGSMLGNSLASSGAFEVMYNGEVIHSKLDQGHFPDNRYIIAKIQAYQKAG